MLTERQQQVLNLYKNNPALSIKQGAELLKISKNGMYKILLTLKKKEYVELRPEHRFVHVL